MSDFSFSLLIVLSQVQENDRIIVVNGLKAVCQDVADYVSLDEGGRDSLGQQLRRPWLLLLCSRGIYNSI